MKAETPEIIPRWRYVASRALLGLLILSLAWFGIWRIHLWWPIHCHLTAIRAAALPTTRTELDNWYVEAPASENAALVLTQAFALQLTFPDSRSNQLTDLQLPPRGQPLTHDQAQLLAAYIQLNSASMAKAREAFKLPKSRYPINLRLGRDLLLPHLAELKSLALTFRWNGIVAIQSGHAANAAASIADILKLAHTLDDEPVLISQLVRFAIISIAATMLERCLNIAAFSEADLKDLASAFASAEKIEPLARGLIGERVSHIAMFRTDLEGSQKVDGVAQWLCRFGGFYQRGFPLYLQTMATNLSLAPCGPPQWLAAEDLSTRAYEEFLLRGYYGDPAVFGLGRGYNRGAEAFALIRLAKSAVGVERFRLATGGFPEILSELTPKLLTAVPSDPFDGAPLRYHRLAKGYMTYSVGIDRQDDGGREKPRLLFRWSDAVVTNGTGAEVVAFRRRYGIAVRPPQVPAHKSQVAAFPKNPESSPALAPALDTLGPPELREKTPYDLTFTVER